MKAAASESRMRGVPASAAGGRLAPLGGVSPGLSDVRRAMPADASAIVALYRDCYASADGRAVADNYPYPQVLDAAWVAAALRQRRIDALVGEDETGIGGAVAAGHEREENGGLAEFFGLAIAPRHRGRGLATSLLRSLCARVGQSLQVAIGEVRTVTPAAALVVQRTTLHPVGFEPFVHFMLAGAESMVAICAASPAVLRRRSSAAETTERVHQLARLVLPSFGVSPPSVSERASASSTSAASSEAARYELVPLVPPMPSTQLAHRGRVGRGAFVTVHQMELLARKVSAFEQRSYALRRGSRLVASARIVRDHRDHRVRILDMRAPSSLVAEAMLRHLAAALEREAAGHLLVIVAEVSTEDSVVQAALEAAGFRPTAYFPAVVVRPGGRFDAVQYSRIFGGSLTLSTTAAGFTAWPRAREIADHVVTSLESVAVDREQQAD